MGKTNNLTTKVKQNILLQQDFALSYNIVIFRNKKY